MQKILENFSENDPIAQENQKILVDQIINENRDLPGATMVVLNELQTQIGFVSEPMQAYVAAQLKVPLSTVHGVVSFYSFFTTSPRGKHTVKFCLGTACYVGGIDQLVEKARQALGIELGETTKDGKVTLEICRCVGACSQAPVIVVDEETLGRVKPAKVPQILRKLTELD